MTATVGLTTKGTREFVGVPRMWQVTKELWESCVRLRGAGFMMSQLQRGDRMEGALRHFSDGDQLEMEGPGFSLQLCEGPSHITFGGPISSLQNVGSYSDLA